MVQEIHFKYSDVYILNYNGKMVKTNLLTVMRSSMMDGRKVNIGLDQSTSNTGMDIFDENHNFIMSMQICLNSGNSTVNIEMLKDFLVEFFKNANVIRIIAEEVYRGYGKSFKTQTKLKYLRDLIKSLSFYCDTFNNTQIETIPANVWRSAFITQGTQGRKREERKQRVLEEAIRRNPAFKVFAQYCKPDYDAIEGYGIYLGWKTKNISDDGTKRLNSSLSKSEKYFYKPYYVKDEDATEEGVEKLIGRRTPYYETDLDVVGSSMVLASNYGQYGFFIPNKGEELWLALKTGNVLVEGYKFIVIAGRIT